jgi:hypothetical protein
LAHFARQHPSVPGGSRLHRTPEYPFYLCNIVWLVTEARVGGMKTAVRLFTASAATIVPSGSGVLNLTWSQVHGSVRDGVPRRPMLAVPGSHRVAIMSENR